MLESEVQSLLSQLELEQDIKFKFWQSEAVQFCVDNKSGLIPLKRGAGKTVIPILASRLLQYDQVLILCSGNALYTWLKNYQRWDSEIADSIIVIDKGMSKEERLRAYNNPKYKVVIAKAKSWIYDEKSITRSFEMLIGDETHKWMRKRKTKMVEAVYQLARKTKSVFFLSGSFTSKGRQDYFAPLQVCFPKAYPSFWRFVDSYIHVVRGPFGMELLGPKENHKFREYTKNHIFRPSGPITGLPKVRRDTIPVKMTDKQARAYRTLSEEMLLELTDGTLVVTQNALTLLLRLRQLLCCPMMIDPTIGYGAAIEAVLDHMDETDMPHCIWATPFTKAIPFMQEALRVSGYEKIVTFQGGMSVDELGQNERFFRANPDSIAICSIPFAQSYELETANPVYFIGFDWDPNENDQTEGRAGRLTTDRDYLDSYYCHHIGTVDDRLLEVNSDKVYRTKPDVNDVRVLQNLLQPKTSS